MCTVCQSHGHSRYLEVSVGPEESRGSSGTPEDTQVSSIMYDVQGLV